VIFLLEQAIAKIEAEIKESKEPYVKFIGQYMLDNIKGRPADATAIMQEGKTIAGSLAFMREKAKKKATGGYAMFTPDEGFEIIMEYYGLQGSAPAAPAVKNRIELDIDALLDV
jgi:hypothetical protein